ncbi:Endonuclease/Exonuclease/phosphatase [Phytophthora pseudosyringae]|uniref:Endonuclease/Exonuclease/phosphatase n=1 Tax=Phytophthora pseudosyringae TaxID=221518 RepID=A0A8T1WHB4_9STRA|nr:Endonuclease/Exonuclease/phosphatase [Phytophthora pseudosyringae]
MAMAMASSSVAHVSFAPGASHLTLQLRLQGDRKSFFRPRAEKLDRVRYRLQLLASASDPKAPKNQQKQQKKRQNGGTAPTVPVKFLDADDQEVDAKTTTVGDALVRTRRLQVGAESFVVLLNQPVVTSLKVLEPMMAGSAANPLPETQFCTADECSWRWFRLEKDDETGDERLGTLVSTERRYTLTEEDLGCRLYVECHAPTMRSEFAEDSKADVVTTPVVPGPSRGVFKERRRMGATSAADKYPDAEEAFRVMSYNVLYDGYATTEHAKKNLFPYVDDSVMKESRRIQLVFQEIEENNSDIVCLQEMGEHVYKRFFEPMLASIGYHGFYSGKTGTTNEGCATFVRTARFEVAEEDTLNLSIAVKNSTNPATQSLLQDFPEIVKGVNRIPSVAQVLVLRSKLDPARRIILSNTHLFYRGDAHMIRLLQGAAVVDHVSQQKAELEFENAAVVMCGDWNAHPRAPLVAFLLDGQIDSSETHWQQVPSFRWNLSRVEESDASGRVEHTTQVRPNRFEHALQLVSACGIPAFTNYVTSFVDTLDYIMVGSKVLQVREVFPFFTEEEVTHEVALPSSTFPSDHVSLVCDLTW